MQARWTVIVAVLVLSAPVAAQEVQLELTQKDVPARANVTGGESLDLSLGVNLTGDGFSCSEQIDVPVNVTTQTSLPSDAPQNASLSVANASKTFPIQAGTYETQAYSQETNATLTAEAGSGLTENVTATVTVRSSFPGANYTSCVPMEFAPASSSPAEVKVDLIADDPPEPEDEGSEDTTDQPDTNDTDTNDTQTPPENGSTANASSNDGATGVPFPWQLTPLAAIGAALAVRRGDRGS